jgi:hypothetical protein
MNRGRVLTELVIITVAFDQLHDSKIIPKLPLENMTNPII